MKITGHITQAEDCGDDLKIVMQGCTIASADWRPISSIMFRIPATDTAKRVYHLGREVVLEIKPQ